MREIRTSGSTRGGALRSPPTLPARSQPTCFDGILSQQSPAVAAGLSEEPERSGPEKAAVRKPTLVPCPPAKCA